MLILEQCNNAKIAKNIWLKKLEMCAVNSLLHYVYIRELATIEKQNK